MSDNNSHKVIFLADDDEDDRMLFLDAISELDVEVKIHEIPDGQELLDKLFVENEFPEIIFLDINMPRKNGF